MSPSDKLLLLHVGTGKTGSSSIQQTLAHPENRRLMSEIGYPIWKAPSQNELAAHYKSRQHLPRNLKARHDRDKRGFERRVRHFMDRVFETIQSHSQILISAEYLAGFNEEEALRLATDFANHGVTRARVLMYVREPSSLYLSMVQQRLKSAHHFKRPSQFRYPFIRTLDVWSSVYDDIVVRPYVRDRLVDQDVVRDFLAEAARFFEQPIDQKSVKEVSTNTSLSAEAMLVLERYRKLFHRDQDNVPKPDSNKLLALLEALADVIPQNRPKLVAGAARVIHERHAGQLDALRTRFGVDLDPGEGFGTAAWTDDASTTLEDILEVVDTDIVTDLMHHCLQQLLKRSC